jgi:acetyltransferase
MLKKRLDVFFNPKSIAIVGASNKNGKVGTVLVNNITKLGYTGKVYFVNPAYNFLGWKKCYATLEKITDSIDLAIIAIPAKFVIETIEKSSDKIKNFVVISSGFSEIGSDGAVLEKKMADLAKKLDLNILGPNSLGFIAPGINLNASFAGGIPNAGNIAFISQSGALAVAIMDKAKKEHLEFSKIISVGNKMQLDETALLEYLINDKDTKVIGMYLEGIKDGTKFLEIAEKVSKKKPIIILKAGKTEKSQKAISSHTGALAGNDEIINVALESAGIIRADNLEEFFNLLGLISFTEAPKRNDFVVITNAGGAGVLTADAFKNKEIVLAEIDNKTKKDLQKILPPEASVENPIDLLGDAMEDRYRKVLEKILRKVTESVICVLTPQEQTPVQEIAETILIAKKEIAASVVTVFIGGESVEKSITYLKNNNIPNFSNPESAVISLDKYYHWQMSTKRKISLPHKNNQLERKKQADKIITKALFQKRGALYFSEAAKIMTLYGINCVKSYDVLPGESVPKISVYPVVAKIDSDKVLHKSDRQALILNIKNGDDLNMAIKKLQQSFPGENLVVQMMQEKQLEIILGIKQDAIFGSVVVYGLGGIYTEIFKIVEFLIAPLDTETIKQSVLKGKIGFLFQGVRGQTAYNIDEFVLILQGVMDFGLENKQIKEFDINPLFLYNDGRSASAADIKIII